MLGMILAGMFLDNHRKQVEGFIVKRRTREVAAMEGTASGTRNVTEYLVKRV
jgi:hypothetical protein